MHIYLKEDYREIRAGGPRRRVHVEKTENGAMRFWFEGSPEELEVIKQMGMFEVEIPLAPVSVEEPEPIRQVVIKGHEASLVVNDKSGGELTTKDEPKINMTEMPPSYYCSVHKDSHKYGSALYFNCFDFRTTPPPSAPPSLNHKTAPEIKGDPPLRRGKENKTSRTNPPLRQARR